MRFVEDSEFERSLETSLVGERIAIIGASGMLGQALVKLLERAKVQHVRAAFSHPDEGSYAKVDIRSSEAIEFFIESWNPTIIINASAYTKVDDAETDYAAALELNSLGPKKLAEACNARNIYLVHVSTDYVFGGERYNGRISPPYSENETCSPVGMYGYSKFLGEEFVRLCSPDKSLIVRTSWLHGPGGRNFIDTMLKLLNEKNEIKVVSDQVGSLCWTPWLAGILLALVQKRITGILQACAQDEGSWYDVAHYIGDRINSKCIVQTQSTLESARKAPRPAYSKLGTAALSHILDQNPPTWKEFVDAHLSMNNSSDGSRI